MLQPKRTKFRKQQKGRVRGIATRGHSIAFGSFAIKALEPGWITSRQLEAARIALTRAMKREGQVWIRIFPDKPITKKPAEVRMGKGKGAPEYWVAVVKPGTILFESTGIPFQQAQESLRLAAQKLPIKTKFVVSNDYVEQQ
jgi:large subunit ribosomal protein L16